MKPIVIDLTGLQAQFGLAADQVANLTEICVNSVATQIYANWVALAKQRLNSTMPEYVQNLINVDKGRFAKQIVLTGVLPNMLEQGASPFDIKEGFKKSRKVKYTIPVYNSKGKQVYAGGDWYLTIPFRIGVPGTLGQAGFAGSLPEEVYNVIRNSNGKGLSASEIPKPYNQQLSREAILNEKGAVLYDTYKHKNSIYEGLAKNSAQYEKTNQNTYGTFRRAGANSDPLSWIHKGIKRYALAEQAVKITDIDAIVNNEITDFLNNTL